MRAPRDELVQLLARALYIDDCSSYTDDEERHAAAWDNHEVFPHARDCYRARAERFADAILNAGWRPPAPIITTFIELEALPHETVVLSRDGIMYERHNDITSGLSPSWYVFGDWDYHFPENIALPATIAWKPPRDAL